jgi:ribonuclease P protein component
MKYTVMLTQNKDFKRCYYRAKPIATPCLVTYVLKTNTRMIRLGITASKKVGNAVMRNRARRVIIAAYRMLEDKIKVGNGYDIVFVARQKTPTIKSTEIVLYMNRHLMDKGVI